MSDTESDDEIVQEFLIECLEGLDQLDRDFVALERNPDDREILGSIFRTVHSIKGVSGMLAFPRLETLTHAAENLLSRLRDGDLAVDEENTTALLAVVDAVRGIVRSIESSGSEGEGEDAPLCARLEALHAADTPQPRATENPSAAGASSDAEASTPTQAGTDPKEVLDAASVAPAGVAETSLRVDVQQLDRLMNQVGELVLARNQILKHSAELSNGAFRSTCQRLDSITSELQEDVMKLRLQPIGNAWSKVPRVVRDLASSCRKRIRVEMDGVETEVDKTILEAIRDPLTHMVRNSCDHGIEMPAEREAAGKTPEGTIHLRARHEGGQVLIELSDDGRGIDPLHVKEKAVEQGIVTARRADTLSDLELMNLILAPGFSTADSVTSLSGRGVGLDVVRNNIERISGSVEIRSEPGLGTVFEIKIPLTLAIIPALMVRARGAHYAIPQVNLLELMRIEAEDVARSIEYVHGAPVTRLRGRLLPLVSLGEALGIAEDASTMPRIEDCGVHIVVLQAADRRFGLIVDEVHDTEEIVVKPLGAQVRSIPVFAGATIRGDGRVALILDVIGFAQNTRVVAKRERSERMHEQRLEEVETEGSQVLVCALGGERRVAIPLASVTRLEEVDPARIEMADAGRVIQYRGRILPLVVLGQVLGVEPREREGPIHVVVCEAGTIRVGLVVDEIVDVVQEAVQIEALRSSSAVAGVGVVGSAATDLLEVEAIVRQELPGLLDLAVEPA